MNTLQLLWRYKWIAVITLFIELIVFTPALILMSRFGNKEVTANLLITPIGSANFMGVFFDAIRTSPGFVYAMAAFIVTIPTLFLFKLALAAGTMASMHENKWSISSWFSLAGEHFLRSFGLLLRWLVIPLILCGIAVLLMKVFSVESTKIKLGVIGFAWFVALSWLFLSLNGITQKERWSLKSGAVVLYKNAGKVAVTLVVFALLIAVVEFLNVQLFSANISPDTSYTFGVIGAFVIALIMRFTILYWQAAHVTIWKAHREKQSV